MRRLLVLAALCGSLVVVAPVAAADRVVERGILQSLTTTAVVLRALDGTQVSVPLGPATRYRLNGRAAPASAIRPGFVTEAVSEGGPAIVLRAFGGRGLTESGVLERRRFGALVVRRPNGTTVRVVLTARTGVWLDGRKATRRELRRGMTVDVVRARDGSARVVLARTAA